MRSSREGEITITYTSHDVAKIVARPDDVSYVEALMPNIPWQFVMMSPPTDSFSHDEQDSSWVKQLADEFLSAGRFTRLPVVFLPEDEMCIDGNHRLEAARVAGVHVPVFIPA